MNLAHMVSRGCGRRHRYRQRRSAYHERLAHGSLDLIPPGPAAAGLSVSFR